MDLYHFLQKFPDPELANRIKEELGEKRFNYIMKQEGWHNEFQFLGYLYVDVEEEFSPEKPYKLEIISNEWGKKLKVITLWVITFF